eukprot:1688788-Alexandrium_andersonii.AAC.1
MFVRNWPAGFRGVPLGLAGSDMLCSVFKRGISRPPGSTGFRRVPPGSAGFCRFPPGSAGS